MMKLSTMTSMLAMTALLGFSITGCTSETTGPGTTTGNGPLNLGANSGSANSINVRWDRQSSDVTSDTVYAMANGSIAQSVVVAAPGNSATITGLQEGVQYSITVNSNGGASSPIVWMTARRSGMIRLYETADNNAGEYSGLDFNGGSAQAISVSSSSANRQNADLVLASDTSSSNPTHLSLVAGSVTSLSGLDFGKNTRISKVQNSVAGGLDAIYYTGDLTSLIPLTTADTVNAFDIPSTSSNPVVMEVKTADSHFARVEIVPQPNGLLYGGLAGQNYIDVIVSYQTTPGAAYASRPRPTMSVESKHTFNGKW